MLQCEKQGPFNDTTHCYHPLQFTILTHRLHLRVPFLNAFDLQVPQRHGFLVSCVPVDKVVHDLLSRVEEIRDSLSGEGGSDGNR